MLRRGIPLNAVVQLDLPFRIGGIVRTNGLKLLFALSGEFWFCVCRSGLISYNIGVDGGCGKVIAAEKHCRASWTFHAEVIWVRRTTEVIICVLLLEFGRFLYKSKRVLKLVGCLKNWGIVILKQLNCRYNTLHFHMEFFLSHIAVK